tara:strand:+ start:179 stop:352 length:174 start_codon:yes stop_codon:yes gene_type:complete
MIEGEKMIWLWFLLAFALGFVLTWFSMIDDKDTDFIIFDSEEELQQACWNGLRKGVK